MKILVVTHQFFPEFYTGTERFALNLAHQLQRMGHGVEIVTYGVKDKSSLFDRKSGKILWREYVHEGLRVTAVKHLSPPGKLNFSVFDRNVLSFFRTYLSEKSFDIIHIAHPMRVGAVVKAAKEKGIRTVLTLTDFWLLCPHATLLKTELSLCTSPQGGDECEKSCFGRGMRGEVTGRLSDAAGLLAMVDLICAPSMFLMEIFKKSFPDISIHRIRHGIDYRLLCPKGKKRRDPSGSERIYFSFLGTILKHKGVDVLIEAFRKVDRENIHLDIHGGYFHEKTYYDRLQKLAENDPRIVFRGSYSHDDVGEILDGTDVVVVPSVWWENSPLAILTSHAFRVPVIASDIGGMKEFVQNGASGYTFKMGDSNALAAVIQKIAASPRVLTDLRRTISLPPRIEEEAFQYLDRYTFQGPSSEDFQAAFAESTPIASEKASACLPTDSTPHPGADEGEGTEKAEP